jgi:hypothetical protein
MSSQEALEKAASEMAEVPAKGNWLIRSMSVFWKWLGGALGEMKDGSKVASLGRLSFVAWFIQAMYQWQTMPAGTDLPASQQTVGWVLLGFITATKGITSVPESIKAIAALVNKK